MRIVAIFTLSSLFAVGSVSAGWIDIQEDDDALSSGDLPTRSYLGMNEFVGVPDQPLFGIEFGHAPNRSAVDWLGGAHGAYSGSDSLDWSGSSSVFSAERREGNVTPREAFTLVEEGYAVSTEHILTTGTIALESDSPREKAYSPRRLRMPEPLSLAVWAILGAAWAGLAWHRRPSHRRSRGQGIDVEEGTRWDDRNRKAILQVIKKNRG